MVYQWWPVLTMKAKKDRAVYWYTRMGETGKKVYYMRIYVCMRKRNIVKE